MFYSVYDRKVINEEKIVDNLDEFTILKLAGSEN
jgi:hypothetical protein